VTLTLEEKRYFFAALLSGIVWGLLVFICVQPPERTALEVFVLCGGAAGVGVSLLFRATFRRARAPLGLLLPLATVPVGMMTFAVLLWLVGLGFGRRDATIVPQYDLSVILNAFGILLLWVGLYPFVYVLSLLNQWILHLLLAEGGTARPATRLVGALLLGALVCWVAFLVWISLSARNGA
jgi:hypothetical protein